MSRVDALIVGGGPAGLATAIRLKRRLTEAGSEASVVVVDKAAKLGLHTLSGALLEAECLDELVPGWQELDDPFIKSMIQIETDELYYLTKRKAYAFPRFLIPAEMRHSGNHAISLAHMVEWLGRLAQEQGVEIITGFSAERLLVHDGAVRGVKLVDCGRGREGEPKANFLAGELIEASVTVLTDGTRGVLSRQFIDIAGAGQNPEIYSLGIKQLIQLPENHNFGHNRSLHTLGYPAPSDVFGGGFLYSMSPNTVALGIVLGLDWKYSDMNAQLELEILKTHPFMENLLKDGRVVTTGAKTIPEGGFYAIPHVVADGGLIAGDAAGFLNTKKIKGIHLAVRSGMCAADAVFDALAKNDFSKETLASYPALLEERGVLPEMRTSKNYRQSFHHGLLIGAPLSQIEKWLPFRMGSRQDHVAMQAGAKLNLREVGMDRPRFTSLSGTMHREDAPSHIKIVDAAVCTECARTYGSPCVHFCPGEVYRVSNGELVISHTNCLHDGSCQVKCPMQNIVWSPPEGGEGPRFKGM